MQNTYASNAVQDSRPSDEQTHARRAGQIAIGGGGVAAGLLVAEADEADAKVDGLLSDVRDGNAYQAEDDGDA